MTPKQQHSDGAVDEVLAAALSVEDAVRCLCRATLTRPRLAPPEVDAALAHLTAAAGALPQVVSQLGDILERADRNHRLEMDHLAETQDPDMAIDTARHHLHDVRELAFDLYRNLDAAHNQTAHIATRPATADTRSAYPIVPPPVHRYEDGRPPPTVDGGPRPGVPR